MPIAVLSDSLVTLPPGVEIAPDLFALAVQALEVVEPPGAGATKRKAFRDHQNLLAHTYLRAVDWTAFDWFWREGALEWRRRHDQTSHGASAVVRAGATIPAAVKREVATRDGWRCRFCGLRVISSATMRSLEKRLPAALPYTDIAAAGPAAITCHPMQCVLRFTWDHLVPRSAGGTNDAGNIVACCGGCQFSRGNCTLEELRLSHPLGRTPVDTGWDGLNGRLGVRPL